MGFFDVYMQQISTTEFTAVISDEAFMHNWNQLTIDVEVFLNDSGLRLADEPELEGYTLQDGPGRPGAVKRHSRFP
jgi:hypothetical protein